MCPQLSFEFTDALTYSSDAFVAHDGVLHIVDTLVTLVSEQRFAVLCVHGPEGIGKTHLGVYCAGLVQALNRPVVIVRGDEIAAWLRSKSGGQALSKGEVVIIDDAAEWLQAKGCEPIFTALADRVLHSKGLVLLLSRYSADDLSLTPQVRSRLVAGVHLAFGPAQERHLDAILRAMAKQRGLSLTPAKRGFILTRVPRNIEAFTRYFTKLQRVAQGAASSTSMKVLGQAADELR
jgi:chromosomal replication initiation ATPase DnaA